MTSVEKMVVINNLLDMYEAASETLLDDQVEVAMTMTMRSEAVECIAQGFCLEMVAILNDKKQEEFKMRRELVMLQPPEAFDWLESQRVEIIRAWHANSISERVARSLLDRLDDERSAYLRALQLGLLGEGK